LNKNIINQNKTRRHWASFIFTLHLAEKWQRHPAADLRGYKPLLQFTIFMKDARHCLFICNRSRVEGRRLIAQYFSFPRSSAGMVRL